MDMGPQLDSSPMRPVLPRSVSERCLRAAVPCLLASGILTGGCGSGGSDTIPATQADNLSRAVEQAADFYDNHRCEDMQNQLDEVARQIDGLDTGSQNRNDLNELLDHLRQLSGSCTDVVTTSTTTATTTTPSTSSSTTDTRSTSSTKETTKSTTTTSKPDTSSTTTSSTTSTTSTPGSGGNGGGNNGNGQGNGGGIGTGRKAAASEHAKPGKGPKAKHDEPPGHRKKEKGDGK